ncbi:unnamed protein product [Didymodactylos carnosus]|uniref:ditrans,polycis-polyprenyl diphosphate synthase [(2E,6E)-farnesyldiphosphate specific] n=1 Tax=Didymodactylos carnosus TaxID=1234261 RepID=A0A8S2ITH8_9BILA|nr:unnamed protein product [Didymodactylos carnosus]CAF3775524.1 unnamed protein product [Didymodactylos carnosus]
MMFTNVHACGHPERNRFVSIFRSNKERTLFGLGPKPPFPFPFAQKTQKYAEKRLLGYTPTELYDVVVDVKKYREFVPWCVKSDVLGLEYPGMFKARMEIGFPPVKESYNALVTYHKPTVVKSVCTEGKLFNHLTTEWKFLPGIETNPKSLHVNCVINMLSKSTPQYTWFQRFVCNMIRYGGTIPRHIAIVMDGNRRYARDKGVARSKGHLLGADKLFEVCQWCHDLGISELTVYAFSLENLKRSQDEIDTLMSIARNKLLEIEKSIDKIHEQQICIRVIGEIDLIQDDLQILIKKLMSQTKHYQRFILNVCFYYTSRDEITNVIKDLASGVEKNLLEINDIDDNLIVRCLSLSSTTLPDIFLRTSGEIRLSDFLLVQCRFSLWLFADVYWPAFNLWHLYWILIQYEMKSNVLTNVKQKCSDILNKFYLQDDEDTMHARKRVTRIENFLKSLENERYKKLEMVTIF